MKVSISKVATYAQPMHNKFFELLSSYCADLNGTEQLTTLIMIITIIRDTAIEEYGEKIIKEIEDALKKMKLEGENEDEN